jgi:hypothetical protein
MNDTTDKEETDEAREEKGSVSLEQVVKNLKIANKNRRKQIQQKEDEGESN